MVGNTRVTSRASTHHIASMVTSRMITKIPHSFTSSVHGLPKSIHPFQVHILGHSEPVSGSLILRRGLRRVSDGPFLSKITDPSQNCWIVGTLARLLSSILLSWTESVRSPCFAILKSLTTERSLQLQSCEVLLGLRASDHTRVQ